jgi:D-3-phosphoglycerate dehydrogenase
MRDAEALVLFRERTRVGEALLAGLPSLKLVSQRGQHPHVDVAALTRRGVLLCSDTRKDAPSTPASELTFALILAGLRDLRAQMDSLRAGRWQAGVGRSAKGRLLGLYGYGGIARTVAGYARAFGMEVVWWGSEAGRARAAADGERVAASRHAFFAEPDVVSLHQRLVPATQGAVTAEDLAAMRPDAILVNTARAGLIAPGALLAALEAGRPGRAALDVFDVEPVTDPADPLVNHPRVIATPHIGFVTEDELELQFAAIFAQVAAFAAGTPLNPVNPEAQRA